MLHSVGGCVADAMERLVAIPVCEPSLTVVAEC